MRATNCFPSIGDVSNFGHLRNCYLFAGSPFRHNKYVFFILSSPSICTWDIMKHGIYSHSLYSYHCSAQDYSKCLIVKCHADRLDLSSISVLVLNECSYPTESAEYYLPLSLSQLAISPMPGYAAVISVRCKWTDGSWLVGIGVESNFAMDTYGHILVLGSAVLAIPIFWVHGSNFSTVTYL